MLAPHVITLYFTAGSDGSEKFISVLEGVFLDSGLGADLSNSGAKSSDNATLYVPFDCKATNALTGQTQEFCPPKTFESLQNKCAFWSVQPGVDCFFVKGRVVEPDLDFNAINLRYDDVFRVKAVICRDFGRPFMRHLQIQGV